MWLMIAIAAGLLSWWLTNRLINISSRLWCIDHPNERSLHSEPTPSSGGLAIIASVFVGLALAAIGFAIYPLPKGFLPKGLHSGSIWIVASIFIITTVSFVDDRRGLPVALRFIVQAIAAVIVVWGVGLMISSITIPGIGTVSIGWVAGPLSVLFLLWMTNLYNFMDGMDGFAGGMTTLGFGFLTYFAWRAGQPFMMLIASVVSISALGFLFHNFPPARIFMGDVGSIPLGFSAGTLMLLGIRDYVFDFWVPILIFSPFILDATVTMLRRASVGQRIWEAHREHYYQRLVLSGWTHRQAVIVEYFIMFLCGLFAMLYQLEEDQGRLAILISWILLYVLLAFCVNFMERRVQHSAHQ